MSRQAKPAKIRRSSATRSAASARRRQPRRAAISAASASASMRSMRASTRCSTSARASPSWSASPRPRAARRSISTVPSARRKCCARRSSAIEGPLRDEEIARLFREIMSACLAQQEPLKVAFLGPEGTFTQAAVLKHFGSSVRALPLPAIDEVFHEVEGGIADFGVVPIENSSEGTVNHTLDMFLGSSLKICGEVELRIHHHLMGRMSALADVKRVCAHPQALAQCRGWLDEQLPERRARRGLEQCGGRAPRARRARHGGDREPRGRGDLWAHAARRRNRGPPRQHHPISGHRPQTLQLERRRPHDAAGVGERYRRCRRAVPPARAVRGARHQHDAHRVAALAQAQVGLCVLHRRRGPRERSAARRRRWPRSRSARRCSRFSAPIREPCCDAPPQRPRVAVARHRGAAGAACLGAHGRARATSRSRTAR